MPKERLHSFDIQRLSILNEQGLADPQLEPKLSERLLQKMFCEMLKIRAFDERAIALQRQGRMGPYAEARGQEAIHIGTAAALQSSDWVVPSFREQGVILYRKIRASTLFLFFMGSEEGNRLARKYHLLPNCVPCATQVLHAVGIAKAAQIKKDPVAVVAYFGDGATSEGDFHEGLNFAGVWQTPNVFICQNNQWAISTPLDIQTHSPTLAQKAIAYNIPGLQVDGNDILGVYTATQEALSRARAGGGPTLLECLSYRMCAHTTSDDPKRYRPESCLEPWRAKDPIDRMEKYLIAKGLLNPGDRAAMQNQLAEQMKQQAEEAERVCKRLTPEEMFQYLFAELPKVLIPQRQEARRQYDDRHAPGVVHG